MPGIPAKPERKSRGYRKKEHVSRCLPLACGLDQIACAESEIRKRREYLSARQDVRRAGLREEFLGSSHVEQVANPVVIGLKRSRIGLGGGVQQSGSSLSLAKCGIEVCVCRPNFVFDLIARRLDLRFGLPNLGFRLRHASFTSPSVEYGP